MTLLLTDISPNNLDQLLNDTGPDKIRKYRGDYNNRPPSEVSFMPPITSTSGRLHSEFVRLLFLQAHREPDLFFSVSQFKSKVGLTLVKTSDLRITLNYEPRLYL